MIRFIKSIYLNDRFFIYIAINIAIFIIGHFIPVFYAVAKLMVLTFIALNLADILLIYNSSSKSIQSGREIPERLSNGDLNVIRIQIKNNYFYPVKLTIIDELPKNFQIRDFRIKTKLKSGQEKALEYKLRPVERGEYHFGKLNLFVSTVIGFISKRYIQDENKMVAVYPSYIQMRKYELMAISNRLVEAGIKKIRRISNNKEFEEIREYVRGDDFRTINWKATARRSQFMVNQYQDEKSQQVFSIIDMGRTMKMPFENMALIDYAINTSLVISNIAMYKQDKAGLITYSKNIHTIVPASRKNSQMQLILESLYNQYTNFLESNLEVLYATVKRKLKQRSLLLLYTNFEGFSSMQRQLKHFRNLAKSHVLVVIFFENTEVKKITENNAQNVHEVYEKTIAEKFIYEKKLIVKELNKYGIHAILTEPAKLTVDTINKYLELKAIGLI